MKTFKILLAAILLFTVSLFSSESKNTIKITADNFSKQVLEASSEKAVIVDFWAPWCGPCRRLGPILENMAKKYNEKITIAKVNVDNNRNITMKYQISSIPAVMVFKNGKVVDSFTGSIPQKDVERFLNKHMTENE